MLQTTRGIVFHHFKYSDSSVIAKIYTEQFGLQSYMVKGVRSKKSKGKAGALQPLSLVEVVAYMKSGKQLHTVRELRLSQPYTSIPFDMLKSTMAIFITEVLYKTIREEEGNQPLFDYLHNSLQIFDLEEDCLNFHLYFLLHLTKYLGFFPQEVDSAECNFFNLEEGVFCREKPLHSNVLASQECEDFRTLLGTNFDGLNTLSISNNGRREVLNGIITYFRLHLEGMKDVKSHQVLEAVLND